MESGASPTGSDAEMAALNIEGDAFDPEWNYTIKPRPREAPS